MLKYIPTSRCSLLAAIHRYTRRWLESAPLPREPRHSGGDSLRSVPAEFLCPAKPTTLVEPQDIKGRSTVSLFDSNKID